MNSEGFFAHLHGLPGTTPAVKGAGAQGETDLSYAELIGRAEEMASQLRRGGVRVLASRLDNGVDWIVADLATLRAGVVHVPVPGFFTDQQQRHLIAAAGVDAIMSASPSGTGTSLSRDDTRSAQMPAGTAKITFTSGTTGTPKGVCLAASTMLAVAQGIAGATAFLPIERHLCALPLPILLENIAGVLAPLLRGATIVAPPLRDVGLQGSSRFDPGVLDAQVRRHHCQSVVLLPQMLRAWTAWLRSTGMAAPPSLMLVAVGGAMVGAATIEAARAVGLPAFEGYGLSEGASVQALNLPGADRIGTAGRLLPHARMRVAPDGEIEIGGALFLGYLGQAGVPDQRDQRAQPAQPDTPGQPARPARSDASGQPLWWRTGDLGEIDADGFVHIRGRKDAVIVTAFGRNVSPEWVETTLQATPTILRAVVLGDGGPSLGAVLWPAAQDTGDDELASAVAAANAQLPDYARIHHWVRAWHGFDDVSGMATANGRPRRAAIAAAYLDEIFKTTEH